MKWCLKVFIKKKHNDKKLVFRSDGAMLPEIGTGHIVRDIAIADHFVSKKICKKTEISFVSRTGGPFRIGSDLVRASGYQLETFDDDHLEWNSPEESKVLKSIDTNLLVVDRLSTDLAWMTDLKSSLKRVISMDDVGTGAMVADAVINAILHDIPACESAYLGYDYLVLKGNSARVKTEVPRTVYRIVASFGGHDSRNLMEFFLENFQREDMPLTKGTLIELLIGDESKNLVECWTAQAEKIAIRYDVTVSILIRPPDFLERLAKADLAVLSGGLTIFDAVSFGVPCIGLPQYLHQLNTLKTLSAKMAITLGSSEMKLDLSSFARLFDEMMNSQDKRQSLKRIGPSLIDRQGINRVAAILSSFVH